MVVAFNRSPTLFSARNEYARSASNLSSSSTARSSRVSSESHERIHRPADQAQSWTPKAVIRARDQECLVSGSPMLDDDSWLGEMKVAHILPNGQPWLVSLRKLDDDSILPAGGQIALRPRSRTWLRRGP